VAKESVMTEAEIQVEVRKAMGKEPDLVLWRNSGGVAEKEGRTQRFGLQVGASDLVGIGPGGVFVAWELKSATGRLSDEQRRFLALVEKRGGHSAVIRSVDDAWAALRVMRERASRLLQPA
jgi:hypothetical protein